MKKKNQHSILGFFLGLVMLLPFFQVHGEGRHYILHWPNYETQAEQLADISRDAGIETILLAIGTNGESYLTTNGDLDLVNTPTREDPELTDYWNLVLADGLTTNIPRAIMYALSEATDNRTWKVYDDDYLTIFGNSMEIPPSTITDDNVNDVWNFGSVTLTNTYANGRMTGEPTDFYYSLQYNNGAPVNYLPRLAVSRLPVTVEDPNTQIVALGINTNYGSKSIIRGEPAFGANPASGDYEGHSIYADVAINNDVLPYYQTILGHSAMLSDNTIKIIATSLDTRSYQMYSTTGFGFPHFINTQNAPEDDREGSYVFYTDGQMVEAFDILSEGPRRTLVSEYVGQNDLHFVLDGSVKVVAVTNTSIKVTETLGNDQDKAGEIFTIGNNYGGNLQTLSDEIANGNVSLAIRVETGSQTGAVFAVTAYDPDDDLFTFDVGASDDENGVDDATIEILDMTAMRDYLLGIGGVGVNGVTRYAEPAFFGDGKLQPTGYIYDLTTSAQNMVDKIEAWSDYIDTFDSGGSNSNAGKVDYFQNALFISSFLRYRWELFSETDILEKINFRDGSDPRAPSLFNGYNISKIFQTNNGVNGGARLLNSLSGNMQFPFTNNPSISSGSIPANTGTVLIGETSDRGEYEITLQGPATEEAFSILGEFQYLDSEVVPNQLDNQVEVFYQFNVTDNYGTADRLEFTDVPEIDITAGANSSLIVLSLLDENGILVDDNNDVVDLSLVGEGNILVAGSQFVFEPTNNVSRNFVNGQLSVNVIGGTENMSISASMNDQITYANVNDDTADVLAVEFLDLDIRMREIRLNKREPFRPLTSATSDNITLRFQVVNRNGNPVEEERRVIFSILPGQLTDAVNQMNDKGIVYGADFWSFDLLRKGTDYLDSDFAQNVTTTPNIPLMISSGAAGMDIDFHRRAVEIAGGYGQAATTTTLHTTGIDNYTGAIGYIGFTLGMTHVYQKGSWDKGEYLTTSDDFTNNRHLLAFETLKQYSNASQPTFGSVYQQGVEAYLQAVVDENDDQLGSIQEAAENLLGILENWQLCGVAGLPMPNHIYYPEQDGFADEVPSPSLTISSNGLRSSPGFDRYESYIVEVPYSTDNSNTVEVDISVSNFDELTEYDSDMKYRYTLVAIALDQPYLDTAQAKVAVSELDFFPTVDVTEIYSTEVTSANAMTYTFSENWAANATGNLTKRGPSLYMVKVEVQEKERSGSGVTESQKAAHFSKEKRLFFRVVNEFVPKEDTQFLIINNTDQDPFRQDNTLFANRMPNVAVRYYEDALDNYNYTKGTLSVNVQSSVLSFDVTADEADDMHWESRVVEGDKIRFALQDGTDDEDEDTSFSPWLRVTDVASDGSTITVDNTGLPIQSGNVLNSVNYIVQRAYTYGHATIDYTYTTVDGVQVPANDTTVTVSIPTGIIDGFEQAVQVGDYFKLLDERAYVKITAISSAVTSGGQSVYTLTLESAYPLLNVWTYYTTTEGWGGISKINTVANGSFTGSYAIYPPDPNDITEPSYLYQTWNVHNYNTSNAIGGGLHGDITQSILTDFSEGDSNGIRHRTVLWANDAAYGGSGSGNLRLRNQNGIGFDTVVARGEELHYVSEQEEVLIDGFLNLGGRLFMSGQKFNYAATGNNSTFFEETLGALSTEDDLTESQIAKVGGDPITGAFENVLNIFDGSVEGSGNTIEEETTKTNVIPFAMNIQEGRSVPIFYYGSPESANDDKIAGVRVSGGSNIAPYASVFLGFDFSNVFYSGITNTFFNQESAKEGRNLLMKKSVDWLRDPSLTSDDRALRIVYEAEDFDGSKTTILLPKQNEITIESDLHEDNGLITDVGVNQELAFVAQNGLLYGETQYTWEVIEHKNGSTLIQDPNEPDNDDWHKVIFKTGSQSGDDYLIRVTSPDQGQVLITVETEDAPLFLRLDTSNGNIINDKMVYDANSEIDFFAFGGSGLGSYDFFVYSSDDFAPTTSSFLTVGQRTVTYETPIDVVKLEDEVTVSMEVRSGSQVATDSITILPPVEIDNPNDNFVVQNGAARTIYASGASSSDYVPVSADTNIITATTVEDTNNIIVDIVSGITLSTNPNDPDVVALVVRDSVYDSSDNIDISVYAAPSFEHATISSNGTIYTASNTVFETLTDGKSVFVPSDGEIPLKVVGGTGSYTVTATSVTNGLSSSNILKVNDTEYDLNEDVSVTYTGNSQLILNTGAATGTISLKVTTLGGSQTTVNIALVSPVDIRVDGSIFNTSSTLRIKPGDNVSLSALNGFANYSWSIKPSTLGSFGTSAASGNFETMTTVDNETFYFIATAGLVDGTIRVDDSQGNFGQLNVKVTNIESLEFRSDSDDLMSNYTLTESTKGIPFTFTGGLADFTVRVDADDPDIVVSKTNSFSNGGEEVMLEAADALTDSDGEIYYRFYFFPRDPENQVKITITDGEGAVLSSQDINVMKASGSTTVDGGGSVSFGDAGGGGGGCLLK